MLEAKQKARRTSGAVAWLLSLAVAAVAGGCANDRGPHPDLPRIGIDTGFTAHSLCGEGVSPALRVISPPAGAATYRIKMTMVNALAGPSWQFDVPATTLVNTTPPGGSRNVATIPEATIPDFPAPCPPERQIYVYRLEVMAMGSGGAPLAYGWSFASAQSLVHQLATERLSQQRLQRARDAAAARGLPPPVEQPVPTATNSLLPYATGSGYPPETSSFHFVY